MKSLPLENRNAARLLAYILKTFEGDKPMSESYRNIIVEAIFMKVLKDLKDQLSSDIPEASKTTIDGIVLKITNYKRLLYTMNKHKEATQAFNGLALAGITLPAGDLLIKIQKKEVLAIKMLSKEDLIKFQTIKICLAESTVLAVNLGWESITKEFNRMLSEAILVP